MLKAAIFDFDGLLVHSEPLWRVAEIDAFGSVGLELTEEQSAETMGLRTDEVVSHWFERHPWDVSTAPLEEVARRIEDRVIDQLHENSPARPGVEHAIAYFERKGLRLGVASSSPLSIIRAGLTALGLEDRFEVLCSAESEVRGKPDPAVYLSAARLLETPPERCVALEDSLAGLSAAKGAGMRCVVVPDESQLGDERVLAADVVLESLGELDEGVWRCLGGGG